MKKLKKKAKEIIIKYNFYRIYIYNFITVFTTGQTNTIKSLCYQTNTDRLTLSGLFI